MTSVSLRALTLDDAPRFAQLADNPKIARFLRDGFPSPYREADAVQFIQSVHRTEGEGTFTRAVCLDGELVGNVSVSRLQDVNRRCGEIGYFLGEPYWGRGIMPQAVKALCELVFAQSDIVRIQAMVFAPNLGSCRVLEKAGFAFEGTMRKGVWKNSRLLDEQLYALVRDDEEEGI